MKNIYCYIAKEGYAARVQDTRSYDAIRFALTTFLQSISRHCAARLAKTFSPGGHSRWCLTIITQADKHTIIYVVTNMFPRITPLSSPGQCPNSSRVLSSLTEKACRTCKVGNNTLLGPSTQVHEEAQVITSTIGASCTIGTATVLRNAYLFDNVTIGPNCVLESCIVGAGVQVGEGSSIARGSLVGDGVKLGPGTVLRPFDRVSKQRQKSDLSTTEDESDEGDDDSELEEAEQSTHSESIRVTRS
jgi:translation initiation factor eIF-2B subunit epsilon